MIESKTIHLPGLNGLRAIAAISVLISHISYKGMADFGLPFQLNLPMAGYGVTLFFVISGFLITYLLLQELNVSNSVNIRKFYYRRILRIWPIYYLYIILCFTSLLLMEETFFSKQIWFYIFFSANIPFVFNTPIMLLAHYWSIGVEEQFYIFWPWLVKLKIARFVSFVILIFIFLIITKISVWYFWGSSSYIYRLIHVTRFHCMMLGALGAFLYFKQNKIVDYFFSNRLICFLSWLLFVLITVDVIHIPALLSQEVFAFISLMMILSQVIAHQRFLSLETKIFDFVGKISYGIYVIHPLVIVLLSKIYKPIYLPLQFKYILVYTSVVTLTIFLSWLSYTYFEKPFLKLKTRFAVVQSSNTMNNDK